MLNYFTGVLLNSPISSVQCKELILNLSTPFLEILRPPIFATEGQASFKCFLGTLLSFPFALSKRSTQEGLGREGRPDYHASGCLVSNGTKASKGCSIWGRQESKQSRSPGSSDSANTGSQGNSLVYRDKQEAWTWQKWTTVEGWRLSKEVPEHGLWQGCSPQSRWKLRGHLLS